MPAGGPWQVGWLIGKAEFEVKFLLGFAGDGGAYGEASGSRWGRGV